MSAKNKKRSLSVVSGEKSKTQKRTKSSSPKNSSPSDSDGTQYTYRIYSERRKGPLGNAVTKHNNRVVFELAKPHYPRMDGCQWADFQKGEKLYLKRISVEPAQEKVLSNIDLSHFNLFEDVDWDLDDSESQENINHWADPEDDEDYAEATVSHLSKFINKLFSDDAEFTNEAWSCGLRVNREQASVYIYRIVVRLPKTL